MCQYVSRSGTGVRLSLLVSFNAKPDQINVPFCELTLSVSIILLRFVGPLMHRLSQKMKVSASFTGVVLLYRSHTFMHLHTQGIPRDSLDVLKTVNFTM